METSTVFIIAGAGTIVITSIARHAATVFRTQARERSRREIAAYIAEGSMTPEQGERLMRANDPKEIHA